MTLCIFSLIWTCKYVTLYCCVNLIGCNLGNSNDLGSGPSKFFFYGGSLYLLINVLHLRILNCSSNLWRTTSEEKRAQERLEKPMYNAVRQAAEVHRQVTNPQLCQVSTSFIEPKAIVLKVTKISISYVVYVRICGST